MKRFFILAIAVAALAGCIYPFDLDDSYYEGGLVVEGDILVGDTTRVTLSTVQPLSGKTVDNVVRGTVWVEGEDGKEYRPLSPLESDSFKIDMTKASSDTRYRLKIHLRSPVPGSNSTDFSSDWLDVQKAPSIDDITYYNDNDNLYFQLSLSSPNGSGCFRWDYEEIWEFHAKVRTNVKYNFGKGTYSYYESGNPYYWCWGYGASTQAGIAIAKSTGGEKLVDRPLLSIGRTSNKLQSLYYLKVKARDISEECYEYLHAIQVNSTSTGSLTTPDPSLVIGNIHSETDPLEVVTGYVEVCSVAVKEIYIGDNYYKPPRFEWEPITLQPDVALLDEMYLMGMRPYEAVPPEDSNVYNWGSRRCLECTADGGTKNKPAFWPSDKE